MENQTDRFTLVLTGGTLSANQQRDLTRKLGDRLRQVDGVESVERPLLMDDTEAITKGEPLTTGIVLLEISKVALPTVLAFISGWLARQRSQTLTLKLGADGGREVTVPRDWTADELENLAHTLQQLPTPQPQADEEVRADHQ